MKNFFIGIGVIVGIFLLIFLANEFSIFGTRFWGVRKANADREVFKESQSYVDGKIQELGRYHHQWIMASPEDKLIIESTIRFNFANFDETKIEQPELYSFLKKIKYN